MSIREAVPADVPAMLAIYAEYVTQTAVSFEYEVPSEAEFTRRLTEHTAVYPWLVWEEDGRVLGYCYAGRAFERALPMRGMPKSPAISPTRRSTAASGGSSMPA